MYTRSYPEKESGIYIPESYGGTALRDRADKECNAKEQYEEQSTTREESCNTPAEDSESIQTSGGIYGLFNKLPITSLFGNLFSNEKFSLQRIGTEEILIIAAAAFLFFSKEGDKECAIMLILLLFIA